MVRVAAMIRVRVHFFNDQGVETNSTDYSAHPCIAVHYSFRRPILTGPNAARIVEPIEAWARIGQRGQGSQVRIDRIPHGVDPITSGSLRTYGLTVQIIEHGDHIAVLAGQGSNQIVPIHATAMRDYLNPPFDLVLGDSFFLDQQLESEGGGIWLHFRPPDRSPYDFDPVT
jgi:hypothetical protein